MAPSCETKRRRPKYDLADILREHLEEYRQQYRLSYQQLRVVNAIPSTGSGQA